MAIRGAAAAADVVITTAGWGVTDMALRDRATRDPLYGIYLAPWLMQAEIVAAAGGAPLAVLPFDPLGPVASAYVAALHGVAPTQSASAAGLSAFRSARGDPPGRTPLTLYTATRAFSVMPSAGASDGPARHSAAEGWLRGGPLTPIGEVRAVGLQRAGVAKSDPGTPATEPPLAPPRP
jgi:hypothetical protein